MTEEVKTNVDDFKDFAQQAKLEVKKQARTAGLEAQRALEKHAPAAASSSSSSSSSSESSGKHKLEDAQAGAAVKLANARDLGVQVGLEARKQARDARLHFDQSAAGSKINEAARDTAEAAHKAKEGMLDAMLPTQKTVEATSTRGVNITHVENPRNERIQEQRAEQAAHEAAERDREKEKERQAMLNSAKASVAEKTEAASAALTHAKDKATVVLGQAALAAKEKLDDYTGATGTEPSGERKPTELYLKTSDRGVDISHMSNPNNEELLARDARKQEVAKAAEPTVADKAKDALHKAGESIKGKWTEATTDAPAPLITPKTSASGIDISSAQNPANAELAAAEEKRLQEQRARELARKKEVVKSQVDQGIVEPMASDAREVKDDVGAQLSALGQSVSAAASKLGGQIKEKWNELTDPAPVNVHAKQSEIGIDTTSIANANNNALGEQIKREHALGGLGAAVAPSKEQAVRQGGVHQQPPNPDRAARAAVAPDAETAAIKTGLDGGVAVRDTKGDVKEQAHTVKQEASAAAAQAKTEIKKAGDKVAEKISEMAIAPTAL